MPAAKLIQVGDRAGQRLDNFLLAQLKGVPRSRVYRMIRSGEVRVNGSRQKPNCRLDYNDKVRVPPVQLEERGPVDVVPPVWIETLRNAVLFEDDDLIVMNKPVGIAVHGGSGEPFGIAEAFEQIFGSKELQLAHRLDKATSGCLVITKNRRTLNAYHDAFRSQAIQKTYDAIVEGTWSVKRKAIDAPIERFHLANGERRVRISDEGQPSKTNVEVVKRTRKATWLRARPLTGRTHQIRVHMQFAGHAVLGDRKYGNRTFRPRAGRLMLHASALESPLIGRVEAPIPADFVKYWDRLAEAD